MCVRVRLCVYVRVSAYVYLFVCVWMCIWGGGALLLFHFYARITDHFTLHACPIVAKQVSGETNFPVRFS